MALEQKDIAMSSEDEGILKDSCMKSSFPVELAEDPLLFAPAEKFQEVLHNELRKLSTTIRPHNEKVDQPKISPTAEAVSVQETEVAEQLAEQGKALTANQDVAYQTSSSPLLDLFTELEATVGGPRLQELLNLAWEVDSLATLKIIWNARSIHLGKANQETFYRCVGWMKNAHPETAIVNLPWLYRSIIKKTAEAEDSKTDDDKIEIVDATNDATDSFSDVPNGGAHGYWKDLSNLLVLAVQGKLDVLVNPDEVLHKPNNDGPKDRKRRRISAGAKKPKKTPAEDKQTAKGKKHAQERDRHNNALKMLKQPFYRFLHVSVARQFAVQLRKDMLRLETNVMGERRKISLAAKWAPSIEGFHDKHTFLASSIAEILFPKSFFPEYAHQSREMYLKRARATYHRLTLAPLRKFLQIVERDISSGNIATIDYNRVPSLAMNTHKDVFIQKDLDRFEKHLDKVAEGKGHINASVLNPSILVSQARKASGGVVNPTKSAKKVLEQKILDMQAKALNGQWNDLVRRTREAGTLASSIAVCDVSGSMTGPLFRDKTTPLDTAIGLSLLLAEITSAPFGGSFITFSAKPEMIQVGGPNDTSSFREKVEKVARSSWSMNTNFAAVFEHLLLPNALQENVKLDEMVKTVFVFSDMQFDAADRQESQVGSWKTSHQRIAQLYKEHGYDLPRMVYWNIAGGMYGGGKGMPKPVTKDTQEALMVSGYGAAMLKMFLDGGIFEGSLEEEEDMEEIVTNSAGDVEVQKVKKNVDSMDGLWRAISHKAYDGLKVVD
ncbi:MAG: hypothetical protein MMC23_006056 [Stictis urceolatum]|nr:hypothetical protein [Stictis urceolata]